MDVDYNYLNEKYTKGTKDGIKQLVKKPKTVSNRDTNIEKGYENKNATSDLIKNNCGVETRFLGHVLWVLAKTSFTICSNHQLWFL